MKAERGAVISLPAMFLLLLIACAPRTEKSGVKTASPETFGFGRKANAAEIARLDIDVRPDGKGLPPGKGTPARGAEIYRVKCASCHGSTGVEGPYTVLVGAYGETGTKDAKKEKTIGNYWPYATTLYDYINRSMPFTAPGSLKPDEVYALTAFLLQRNKIIGENSIIDAKTLPEVLMPAKKEYVNDNRRGGDEVR